MRLSKLVATALCVGAIAFSFPAFAQGTPFKLVILWNDSIAVVDYPTAERCEAAKVALERRKEQELKKRKPEFLPGGGMIISEGWKMEMICIPG
jgi:hypothetical protein